MVEVEEEVVVESFKTVEEQEEVVSMLEEVVLVFTEVTGCFLPIIV